MMIFPSLMSLHTAIRACSMVSPALRMETPVIYTNTQEEVNVLVMFTGAAHLDLSKLNKGQSDDL